MNDWSLNEIAVLSRKAARGAGLSWGLAEEAGDAVRWLDMRGMPGAEALLSVLIRGDGSIAWPNRLSYRGDVWHAPPGCICPVTLGAVLCDDPVHIETLHAVDVVEPILLVPFIAWSRKRAVLEWGHTRVAIDTDHARIVSGDPLSARPEEVFVGQVSVDHLPTPPRNRARIRPEIVAGLERFAARTYAPATDASRAGAGGGDAND